MTLDGFIVHYGPIANPGAGKNWHLRCACQAQDAVAMSTNVQFIDCAKCLSIRKTGALPITQALER
jgi:hypothetical protein